MYPIFLKHLMFYLAHFQCVFCCTYCKDTDSLYHPCTRTRINEENPISGNTKLLISLALNGLIVYPMSTRTLLKADCLTPIQLSVRPE